MNHPTILAFDTSDHHCGAAILAGGEVTAALHEPMAKGQAERLFPMIDEVMRDAGVTFADLDALGVGVGPGNFTGIRISVSAARGLALSLGIKAVGIGLFEALAFGADVDGPLLLSLKAAKNRVYLQHRHGDDVSDITTATLEDLPIVAPDTVCIGAFSPEIADRLGITHRPARHEPAAAIAHIAALNWQTVTEPPAPLYMRAANALPSSDPPPVILPDDA